MAYQTKIIALIAILAFIGAVLMEDSEDKTSNHTICTSCDCNTKTKTLDCDNINLYNLFSKPDWVSVNDSGIELDVVKFSNNGIANVTEFPELKIRVLTLRSNKISTIEFGAFRELIQLEELDLSYNRLTYSSLKPQVFQGKLNDKNERETFQFLRVLRLGNNNIHALDTDVFSSFPQLEHLSLDSNPFLSFDHGSSVAISWIYNLKFLDISYLELTGLPTLFFQYVHGPRQLEILNLTGNLMSSVPDALKSAINLKYLELDENIMESFNATNSIPYLPNLEILSISFMQTLKSIGKHAFSNLPALTQFICTNNPHLSSIDEKAISSTVTINDEEIEHYPKLTELYLHNNNLSTLSQSFFGDWDTLDVFDIRINPWACDCRNRWLIEIIKKNIVLKTPNLVKEIECNEPRSLVGQQISKLTIEDVLCSEEDDGIPTHNTTILMGVLVGLTIGILISSVGIFLYRRGCFGLSSVPGAADYSRTFYKRADLRDDLHI